MVDPGHWQDDLRKKIPLCAAMQIEVRSVCHKRVELFAPLKPNLNHQNTGFGGSLVSIGLLAGWTLIRFRLDREDLDCDLVVYRETTHFRRPVTGPMYAICTFDDPNEWTRFLEQLGEHRQAKLRLRIAIQSDGREAASLKCDYVALYRTDS